MEVPRPAAAAVIVQARGNDSLGLCQGDLWNQQDLRRIAFKD